MITRPLLAASLGDINSLTFPVLATPKIDGIRVLKVGGKVVTRQFKPLPNNHIREMLEQYLPDNIDGEVVTPGSFNDIQSAVMSVHGTPDFTFYGFDYVKTDLNRPYQIRIHDLDHTIFKLSAPFKVIALLPQILFTVNEVLWYEQKCVDEGFEGIMIRTPNGKYKCGRSTEKEQILLKLKRFLDAEAVVVGFEEKLQNTNDQDKNNFGLSKRSSKKGGLIPSNTLGCLLVQDVTTGVKFGIGSGFTDSLRDIIWKNREKYLGTTVTYKYQMVGVKNAPRFPVFLGFRKDLE